MRERKRDDLLPGMRTIGFERRVTVVFMVSSDAVLIEGSFTAVKTLKRPSETDK
jgi:toxin ParE1/3/4